LSDGVVGGHSGGGGDDVGGGDLAGGSSAASGARDSGSQARQRPEAPAPQPAPAPLAPAPETDKATETVASRRARVLAAHTSLSSGDDPDTDNARGAGTLDTIIKKMDVCVGNKAFYCEDKTSSNSVHFIVKHVVDALPPKDAEKQEKVEIVKREFPRVVVKVLLDNPTYSVLPRFVELFAEMDSKGCHAPSSRLPIERLALYDPASSSELDLSGTELTARMRLIDSVVYKDFESTRAAKLLAKAKEEVGVERETTLKVLLSASGNLSPLFQETVKDLLHLWNTEVELPNRLVWALQKPSRIYLTSGFAKEPEQDYEWAWLNHFITPPPTWPSDIEPAGFFGLLEKLVCGGGRPFTKNTVIGGLMDLCVNLDKNFGLENVWVPQVLLNSGAIKLGAPSWLVAVDPNAMSEEQAKALFRLLSVQFPNPEPDWLTALKRARRALKSPGLQSAEALQAEVGKFEKELEEATSLLAASQGSDSGGYENLKARVAEATFNLNEAQANLAGYVPPEIADKPPKKKARKAGESPVTAKTEPPGEDAASAAADCAGAGGDAVPAAAKSAGAGGDAVPAAADCAGAGGDVPAAAESAGAGPAAADCAGAAAADGAEEDDDLTLDEVFNNLFGDGHEASEDDAEAPNCRTKATEMAKAKPKAKAKAKAKAEPANDEPEQAHEWAIGDICKLENVKKEGKTFNKQTGQVI